MERHEQRWNRAWALTPYGFLLLASGVTLAGDEPGRAVTLALAAVLAVWHGWFLVLHPHWWETWKWQNSVYFTGLIALATVLALRSPAFHLFVPACYIVPFLVFPGRAAYAGLLAANIPALVVDGADGVSTLIALGVATPGAALIGGLVRAMEREAVRRREINSELVAMVAENARLAREAGVAEERARLAREIHDTVAQGLTGIVTQLEAIGELPAEARARLDTARGLARTSLDEVRRSIDALRPGPLADARLSDAVAQTVAAWGEQYRAPAGFTATGTPLPLHSEVEVTLLRAAQETLSNVGRHAGAGRVQVTLSYMEDVIVLDVRDDGAGFDPAAAGGFGLTALRQRVAALGGTVEIESAPGAGTAVSVTVPVIGVER
ncbi:sensor histidine kinase [Actinoplanes sp. G11-F43]|uniref:sensor histidine kinase n=1 Tax=Actinoplanes sp. G11-F43 TaxID=3424130 RepID=UPI003D32DDC1